MIKSGLSERLQKSFSDDNKIATESNTGYLMKIKRDFRSLVFYCLIRVNSIMGFRKIYYRSHSLFTGDMKIYLSLMVIFSSGCLGPVKHLYTEDETERTVPVYIVSHGWHVGIAIEQEHIKHLLPEHPKMPDATILKFGWGDGKYYVHDNPGFGLLMRAAIVPTRSVIHVVGMDIPIDRYFSSSRIVKVQVSTRGAEKLGEFISERFRTGADGSIYYAANGLYTNSTFFNANGLYFIPKTSNTWTARALRQTGFPITPIYAITSGNVIQQARKHGELIR
jgi:uncharacterized protein (TIGR02117 family)